MFDTHCHLNFKVFRKNLSEVIERARKVGVNYFVVPGTDLESSKRAVEIAEKYDGVYAAVGIHPHHTYEILNKKSEILNSKLQINHNDLNSNNQNKKVSDLKNLGFENYLELRHSNLEFILKNIEGLLSNPKVVAVGEIGLDKHQYTKTKYQNYRVNSELVEGQKELLIKQIKLASKYKKSVILHNRGATEEILKLLTTNYYLLTTNIVFHCCEPDERLLEFAIKHNIFIGVDGDVTYIEDKQEFVKRIPLELLVLETDSPFLLPEPLRSQKNRLFNGPKNLPLIAEFIAKVKNVSINQLIDTTEKNAKTLFSIFTGRRDCSRSTIKII